MLCWFLANSPWLLRDNEPVVITLANACAALPQTLRQQIMQAEHVSSQNNRPCAQADISKYIRSMHFPPS